MFAFAKAIIQVAKALRRIAIALEDIRTMYELELKTRGIHRYDPSLNDETIVSYGAQPEPKNQ